MRRPSKFVIASAAVVTAVGLGVTTVGSPAGADVPGWNGQLRVEKTIADNYVGPLQFAVSAYGIYVADGFTSTLNKVGREAPIATGGDPETGGDVGGVAVNPRTGDVAYTSSSGDHSKADLIVLRHGKEIRRADLAEYENTVNPDRHVRYGIHKGSDCARQAIADAGFPVDYRGQKDSHPYAVASLADGSYAVADAGGNDILRVAKDGTISTLLVLPRRLWTIPLEYAQQNGLPDCVAGTQYWVEGVPTDVETGPDGALYISSLPGADAPNSGVVYRLDRHGLSTIGRTLNQAVNLAVTKWGTVYVAELGSGRISVLHKGLPKSVLQLPGAVGLESYGGHLYASVAPALTGQQAPGSVVMLGKVLSS